MDIAGVPPKEVLAKTRHFWNARLDADPNEDISLEALKLKAEAAAAGMDTSEPASGEEVDFATTLVQGVVDAQAQLDNSIEKASLNWRIPRMPIVDRNILRIGAFELSQRRDIPVSVSINEAIELAKRYGSNESRAFINGILDRIAADLGRGGRRNRS
jgi:N utilization substance protein B